MNAADSGLNQLWLLICTALVFFMQAGFCCLEAGTVRRKNSVNVALKNIVDFLVATFVFYLAGYSLMFGPDRVLGLIGEPSLFLSALTPEDHPAFLYQLVFCGTAATIVSGAVAERLRFLPYIFMSAALSLFIYPVFGHWVWGGGWLSRLGYHDFAGSSTVHMVGGFVALAGILLIGPRKGRFRADGTPADLPSSDIPLVALGTFILFFGWIGFNGGSAPFGPHTATIVLNTVLGGAFGGLACLLVGWAMQGISGASTIMNGTLAGLVAVTAGADIVSTKAAALIGLCGGSVYYLGERLTLRMKLDDAVGAFQVHGLAGVTGVLLAGVFASEAHLAATSQRLGDSFGRGEAIFIQFLGAAVCLGWSFLLGLFFWWLTGRFTKLRVTEAEEKVGLNYSEHLVRSPADEAVSYLQARMKGGAAGSLPDSLEEEMGRLVFVVEEWQRTLDEERRELERLRGFLSRDTDRLHEMVEKCHRENREQSLRLGIIFDKVAHVERALKEEGRESVFASRGGSFLPLLSDAVENVRQKLSEMQSAASTVDYYWEQIRDHSSSIFRQLRSPRGEAVPASPPQAGRA